MPENKGNIISINCAANRGTGEPSNRQRIVNTERKPPACSDIPSEMRRSIAARVTVHGDPLQRVARSSNVSYNDVLDAVVHELQTKARNSFMEGYKAGRRSTLPPHTPAPQRKVA